MRSNIAEFPDFVKLCAELGFDSISPTHLYAHPPADGRESLFLAQDLSDQKCRGALDEAYSRGLKISRGTLRRLFFSAPLGERLLAEGVRQGLILEEGSGPEGAPCPKPWRNLIIRADGSSYPCCHSIRPGADFASVKSVSLREAWRGAGMKAFRDRLRSANAPGFCRDCRVDQNGVPGRRAAHFPG